VDANPATKQSHAFFDDREPKTGTFNLQLVVAFRMPPKKRGNIGAAEVPAMSLSLSTLAFPLHRYAPAVTELPQVPEMPLASHRRRQLSRHRVRNVPPASLSDSLVRLPTIRDRVRVVVERQRYRADVRRSLCIDGDG
jgi:hypothetical protein